MRRLHLFLLGGRLALHDAGAWRLVASRCTGAARARLDITRSALAAAARSKRSEGSLTLDAAARGRAVDRPAALLHDVRQLVGEHGLPGVRAGVVRSRWNTMLEPTV